MIFVTGDCHGDFSKFTEEYFPEQKELTRQDIVIVCGDFGIWHDTPEEREWLAWLDQRPFTTVFVDGNHENFDRLCGDEFPVVDFCGAKAQQIRPGIFHLLRGQVYLFEGKKFFAFGGASSHDISDGILDRANFQSDRAFCEFVQRWAIQGKMFRINHLSWWKQELPTEEELAAGLQTLIQNENKVDYIISHCAPQEIVAMLGLSDTDRLCQWFNTVAHTVSFKMWYFGHYHGDLRIMDKYTLLYDRIERVL